MYINKLKKYSYTTKMIGLSGGNRTHNRNLGGSRYIHLTTERYCL